MGWSWAVDGVNEDVPRTTGPECNDYMTHRRRIIEAIFVVIVLYFIMKWAVKRLEPITVNVPDIRGSSAEKKCRCSYSPNRSPIRSSVSRCDEDAEMLLKQTLQPPSHMPPNLIQHSATSKATSTIRYLLLISMTFIFGMEMGFKFAEKTVIFVLNPCHLQTIVQIYLLATKPTKISTILFRIQMNFLNGPLLAFVFPEVETRLFNLEQFTYWVQHALLYIIPVYLLKAGIYKSEDLLDFNWSIIGYSICLVYHFVFLNAISMISGVNLNHMLCPALADPFEGPNYRLAAIVHEGILCPLLNKLTVLVFTDTSKPTTTTYRTENDDQQTNNETVGILTTKND